MIQDISYIIILIIVAVGVALINHENGRIEMCQEIGKFYTVDKECLGCIEVGGHLVNDSCSFETSTDKSLEELTRRYLNGNVS